MIIEEKISSTSEVEHSCTMKFNVHVVFEDYMANLSKNTAEVFLGHVS